MEARRLSAVPASLALAASAALLPAACIGPPTDPVAARRAFASCDAWILGDGLHLAAGEVLDLRRLEELLALKYAPSHEVPAGSFQRPPLPQRIGIADDAPLRAVLTVFLLGAPQGFWGDYQVVCEDGATLPFLRRHREYPVVMVDFDVAARVGAGRGGGAAAYVASTITARSYDAVLLRTDADALLAELRGFLDREAPASREQLLVRVSDDLRWGDRRDLLVALHHTLPGRALGLLARRPLYPPSGAGR